ncbi:TM0106 family RecB-like putative nuclease [uncultured Sphingomonas sp.]|uniref:TM0106 family RecB-like putative nuclease n=1 Tax=uncultured Sphingomonas sp. TaxID=158754 RepID=UPI003748BAFF
MSRSEARLITASMMRDLVVCERRPWLDVHGDADVRAPVAPFVELLWRGGMAHEDAVLGAMPGVVADLRREPPAGRMEATLAAMAGAADHVLGGELHHDDLLGRPDVLSRYDGRWFAGDAKSGTPFMPDGLRPKMEYAAQVGLYAHMLGKLGIGDPSCAFIIGAAGEIAWYDLNAPLPGGSLAERVAVLLGRARSIVHERAGTRGAAGALCGLCHWRDVCAAEMKAADDLTLLAGMGRSLRTLVEPLAANRAELAALDVSALRAERGERAVPGLGMARLERMRDRALLSVTPGAKAYARRPLNLPVHAREWHLDIEADPTAGPLVYLHGIWERVGSPGAWTERFIPFLADGDDGERRAFADVWAFLTSDDTAAIYYYSPYERTSYRMLQRRYPDVCGKDEVDALFASSRVVDLYSEVVAPHTEWPLPSYGLKAIAKSQGFKWSAADAGGASSIAWWDEWRRTGDRAVLERIVDYNRSDVIASAVVLDALRALPVRPG